MPMPMPMPMPWLWLWLWLWLCWYCKYWYCWLCSAELKRTTNALQFTSSASSSLLLPFGLPLLLATSGFTRKTSSPLCSCRGDPLTSLVLLTQVPLLDLSTRKTSSSCWAEVWLRRA